MEESGKALPSPKQLRGKIILKHKVPKERRSRTSSVSTVKETVTADNDCEIVSKTSVYETIGEDWSVDQSAEQAAEIFPGKILYKQETGEDQPWKQAAATVEEATLVLNDLVLRETTKAEEEDVDDLEIDTLDMNEFEVFDLNRSESEDLFDACGDKIVSDGSFVVRCGSGGSGKLVLSVFLRV